MRRKPSKTDCCGCGVCVELCPTHGKVMAPDPEGFDYPSAGSAKCAGCGRCASVCPMRQGIHQADANRYLGAKSRSDEWRARSASGAFFPALAAYILQRDGVVLGAAFDDGFVLKHRAAHSLAELPALACTKYVQSSQGSTYAELEAALGAGRWVLYAGTPCQCEGVLQYVKHRRLPREKLVLMDLVCYGVPSPVLWQKYIKYLERQHGGPLTEYRFRDKSNGGNGQAVSYVVNGRRYTKPFAEDLFCALYFRNYSLRPACHHCPFTGVERDTDFTAGDFWGIGHVRPDFDDGHGTSMVILHTKKADRIWQDICTGFDWFPCTKKDVLQREQPRLHHPTPAAPMRKLFYLLYEHLPFPVFAALLWNGKRLRLFWRI